MRGEVERLKTALRERLGYQLDNQSVHHLRTRIDELSNANRQLRADNDDLTTQRRVLDDKLRATEDDLAAVRATLRRMIKAQTHQLQDVDAQDLGVGSATN